MKKLYSLILLLALAAVFAMAANAEEIGYSGPLDPYTGLAEQTAQGKPNTDLIQISGDTFYDQKQNYYIIYADDAQLISNIVSGFITTTPVYIVIPNGINATLYRNGDAVANPDYDNIREVGSYVLDISGGSSTSIQPLKFTIVSPETGAINEYRMPEGFRINSLVYDNVDTECDPSVVSLVNEGPYEIRYSCYESKASYSLNITVDHTPPEITLSGVVNGGRSKGQVNIAKDDRDTIVNIYIDGKKMIYNEELTRSGTYKIIASDRAGNTSVYDFIIPVYFNTNGILLVVLLVAIIAAAIAYPFYVRKHLRVR